MQTQTLNADYILNLMSQHADQLRKLGVIRIGLFGSQARGEAAADSDIDLLLTMAEPSYDMYWNILTYLENLLDKKIDLVLESGLKPAARPFIMADVIYVKGF